MEASLKVRANKQLIAIELSSVTQATNNIPLLLLPRPETETVNTYELTTTTDTLSQSLASIRQRLDTLRADRSSYIKSSDIDQIFQELATQLPIIKEHDHAVDDKLREEG